MVKNILGAFKVLGIIGGMVFLAVSVGTIIFNSNRASTLVIPNTFSVGQVADPSAVNANFSAIQSVINGSIDDTNWSNVGPKLSCANHLDLTASCITTTALVTDASQTFFSLSPPADGTNINCTGASPVDVTNWTWSLTSTGSPLFVIVTGVVTKTASAATPVDIRLNIGGSSAQTITADMETNNHNVPFTLSGRMIPAAGPVTVKVQCLNGNATLNSFKNGYILALEFKK